MVADGAQSQDLTVKGESVERVYGMYQEKRYIVNRRYQRKLIWTLDEKKSFIDSIIKGYPVPIILLAEDRKSGLNTFEIIDGMQRLNAVMSFIDNEYMVNDGYFDLNTMAVTKALLDGGELSQKTPALSREQCVRIAGYLLPFSIFEFTETSSVDDVFRRINSGGRQLSNQELRTAGATGHFAQAVRRIAAKVRGDDSYSDTLLLNTMHKISITHKELNYGISVDEMFWVKEGILPKKAVRESKDEEIVADVLSYMVGKPQSSRSEFLDDFFGIVDDDSSRARYDEIEVAVQKRTADLVVSDFQRTLDELKLTLGASGQTFGQLLFNSQPTQAPRYFQAVFLAFHNLVVRQGMAVKDRNQLVQLMTDSGKHIHVAEGGSWGAEHRQKTVDSVTGMYLPAFGPSTYTDPAKVLWITQLENLMSQSYTEQSAYDFKQGFLLLDSNPRFDDGSFEKILQTCVGIANIKKGYKGYVLVGIAENMGTVQRLRDIFGIEPKVFESFYVAGVDHEAIALGKTHDQLFQYIIDKIKNSACSSELKDYIVRNLKAVRYFDKTVYVFEVEGQEDVSNIDGRYFIRTGPKLEEIDTKDLSTLIRRYLRGF